MTERNEALRDAVRALAQLVALAGPTERAGGVVVSASADTVVITLPRSERRLAVKVSPCPAPKPDTI